MSEHSTDGQGEAGRGVLSRIVCHDAKKLPDGRLRDYMSLECFHSVEKYWPPQTVLPSHAICPVCTARAANCEENKP